MARPRKNLELQTRHNTKKEIEIRKREESLIKSKKNDVQKPPVFLDKVAKKEWKRVVANQDMIDNLDYSNLIGYCTWFSEFLRLNNLKNDESLDASERGAAVNLLKTAGEQMRRFGDACGISRSARLKAAAEAVKQEDSKIEDTFGDI